MTSTPGRPTPEDDDGQQPETGGPPSEDAAGVELGMSEKSGGTFEPEEAPGEGERPDG